MSTYLMAGLLAFSTLLGAAQASAQSSTREEIRMIENEYARTHEGRIISDQQLEYYLDRRNAGWTMDQIRRDMLAASRLDRPWRPQTGWVQREMVCTSIDSRYRECPVPFRGTAVITQQISRADCIKGRTWGQRNGTVWVDRGCRARFGIINGGIAGSYRDRRTVVCTSNHGRYRECATGFRGRVALVHELNNSSACIEGRTWGQREGAVWVSRGCRAQFQSIGRPGRRDDDRIYGGSAQGSSYTVICSSVDGRRNYCSWDSRAGAPRLVERLSRSGCIQGQDWGYDGNRIWVDDGCRARFGYR